jgi:predicted TIM-barrel fold metal-dependent hydrolase
MHGHKEPMMIDYPLISADDHLDLEAIAPTMFTDHAPARLRDRMPHVVPGEDGEIWTIDGKVIGPSGRRPSGRVDREPLGLRPGEPHGRMELMDRDNVQTHVIFGPATGFTFADDPEIRLACTQAYNDHMLDFAAVNPRRLVPLAMMPGQSAAAATAELLRCVRAGHRGVLLPLYETDGLPFGGAWEGFWAAANETKIPVNFHLGGGSMKLKSKLKSWTMPAMVSIVAMQMDEALATIIFSGTFDRFPDLRVVFGESGIGWVPYMVNRMDACCRKYNGKTEDIKLKRLPSEYYGSNVLHTYEEDDLGLAAIDVIGADAVMWASDFPHGDSTWPHSHGIIEKSALTRLDDESRRKILHGNAARLYGLD